MGFIFNSVKKWQLQPGDHIYNNRMLPPAIHHGIYIGDGMVIQYYGVHGEPPPQCDKCLKYLDKLIGEKGKNHDHGLGVFCLDCFLDGHALKRYEYSASELRWLVQGLASCCRAASNPKERVLNRAILTLREGFGTRYDQVPYNSRDFAIFCKTGIMPRPLNSSDAKKAAMMFGLLAVGLGTLSYGYEIYKEKRKSFELENGGTSTTQSEISN